MLVRGMKFLFLQEGHVPSEAYFIPIHFIGVQPDSLLRQFHMVKLSPVSIWVVVDSIASAQNVPVGMVIIGDCLANLAISAKWQASSGDGSEPASPNEGLLIMIRRENVITDTDHAQRRCSVLSQRFMAGRNCVAL